jgi:hypothetical protein
MENFDLNKAKERLLTTNSKTLNEETKFPELNQQFLYKFKNGEGDELEYTVEYIGNDRYNELFKVISNRTSPQVIKKHPDIYGKRPGDIILTGPAGVVRSLKLGELSPIED